MMIDFACKGMSQIHTAPTFARLAIFPNAATIWPGIISSSRHCSENAIVVNLTSSVVSGRMLTTATALRLCCVCAKAYQ